MKKISLCSLLLVPVLLFSFTIMSFAEEEETPVAIGNVNLTLTLYDTKNFDVVKQIKALEDQFLKDKQGEMTADQYWDIVYTKYGRIRGILGSTTPKLVYQTSGGSTPTKEVTTTVDGNPIRVAYKFYESNPQDVKLKIDFDLGDKPFYYSNPMLVRRGQPLALTTNGPYLFNDTSGFVQVLFLQVN